MQWYLLKTWAGREEELVQEIRRTVPGHMYKECFVIYQERIWRKQQKSIKIFIVDKADTMTIAAQNALLKTLEEPPAHIVFILATTDPQKVPATILSRCQRFDFHRITTEEITQTLLNYMKQKY